MTNREMDSLVVGSVVRRGDSFRVVRKVTKWPAGPNAGYRWRLSVTFAIKRRSWTGKPFTVYTRSDLRTLEYVPTPVVHRLRSKLDRLLACDILTGGKTLSPEDVRGMP